MFRAAFLTASGKAERKGFASELILEQPAIRGLNVHVPGVDGDDDGLSAICTRDGLDGAFPIAAAVVCEHPLDSVDGLAPDADLVSACAKICSGNLQRAVRRAVGVHGVTDAAANGEWVDVSGSNCSGPLASPLSCTP